MFKGIVDVFQNRISRIISEGEIFDGNGPFQSKVCAFYFVSHIGVSLTENPIEEVYLAKEILKTLGLRKGGVNFISCPTCGRTQIDLIGLAKKVEERFKNLDLPITIAVMGCPVNGPGEAKHADFGIAGAIKEGYIFKKGEIISRVPEVDLINSLEKIIMETYSLD